MNKFNFKDLFVLDLANNHQGDVEHALNIIRQIGAIAKEEQINAGFKFQFRQLDTFIHPDFQDRTDVKHISRFMSTRLDEASFAQLTREVKKQGMVTISTPFDEESVEMIQRLDIEVIKVASCSAYDWPLLKKVASAGKPVIISTAGLTLNKIDRIVSFFETKRVEFAIMHCVAIYPTPEELLNLNQISLLKKRYPNIPIGFSTHEDPANFDYVTIAQSKGAELFERHVGIANEKYQLNTYSSTPEQVSAWVKAVARTKAISGGDSRAPSPLEEISSLKSLKRGIYAKSDIAKGEKISIDDVFFAMPLQDEQLISESWFDGIIADRDYEKNEALHEKLADHELPDSEFIYQLMLQVKAMLNNARIIIGKESSVELSHHYGLQRIREFGAIIIDCINREYCKKLIIMLPRQKHPYHLHKEKEETFQVLWGDLEVELNGYRQKLIPGDTFLVPKNSWHKFHTLDGVIFEEVSTTHYNNDSYYEDERIAKLPREERKTEIPNWERELTKDLLL